MGSRLSRDARGTHEAIISSDTRNRDSQVVGYGTTGNQLREYSLLLEGREYEKEKFEGVVRRLTPPTHTAENKDPGYTVAS